MTDWRTEFQAWMARLDGEGRLTAALRHACDRLMAEAVPDPAERWGVNGGTRSPDLAWLRRHPIEGRLTALRILNEIGVMSALKGRHPELHDRLLMELRGDPQG